MASRWVGFGVVAVVVVTLVVTLVRGFEGFDLKLTPPVPEAPVKSPHSRADESLDRVSGVADGGEASESPDGPVRSQVVGVPPAPAIESGVAQFTVVVVDAASGARVVDADVFAFDSDYSFHETVPPAGVGNVPSRNGRTDANGEVELPREWTSAILARTETHYGSWHNRDRSATPEEVEVRVHPIGNLIARVQDASGTPVEGVAVQVLMEDADDVDSASVVHSGSTDARGTVVWAGYGMLAGVRPPGTEVSLHCTGAGIEVMGDFVPMPPLGGELVLEVPSTGRLEVRLEDAGGRLLPGRFGLYANATARDPATGLEFVEGSGYTVAESGRATFPGVALGRNYTVHTPFSKFVRRRLEGPTADSPSVQTVLRPDDGTVVLIGRAIDRERAAVEGARIRANARGDRAWSFATTESSGDFALLLDPKFVGAEDGILYLDSARGRLSHELQSPLRAGTTLLGDVRFDLPQVLVSGRVLESPDAPCHGFSITVETREADGDWGFRPVAVTRDGATFAVRSSADPSLEYRLVISPNARCHVPPDPIVFEPGTTDLDVQLERGHTLEAMIRCPGEMRWANWRRTLVLRPVAGRAAAQRDDSKRGVANSGSIRLEANDLRRAYWNGLLEGTYRLEVKLHLGLEPIVGGEFHVPFADGSPPRAELDLTEHLQRFVIRVHGDDGSLVRPRLLAFREGQLADWRDFIDADRSDGLHGVIVPEAFDVAVLEPGYRPVVLRAMSAGEHTLRLESGRSRVEVLVESTLPDGCHVVATPAAGAREDWEAALLALGVDRYQDAAPASSAPLESGNAATLEFELPGRHDLRVVTKAGESLGEVSPAWIDAVPGERGRVVLRVR